MPGPRCDGANRGREFIRFQAARGQSSLATGEGITQRAR